MKMEIPEDLVEDIKQRMKGSEFDSVEEYVMYVLEEVVQEENEDYEEEKDEDEEWSEEDEEKVKDRLRSLGYLE